MTKIVNLVKIFVFYCVKCNEDFESFEGQHRQKCPSCGCLCSVKDSRVEEQ